MKNKLLTFPETVHENFTIKWKLSCFPALTYESFFYGSCMKQDLFLTASQTLLLPLFFFFFKQPGGILNTNFSHNQVEFSLTPPRPVFYPLGLTMFCRMPSKMGFSTQSWHLNPPVQATVRNYLDLENIHLHTPYATQHVLKFQGINTLCACPYSRAMSEKGTFI